MAVNSEEWMEGMNKRIMMNRQIVNVTQDHKFFIYH